jgi:hypothetical protein
VLRFNLVRFKFGTKKIKKMNITEYKKENHRIYTAKVVEINNNSYSIFKKKGSTYNGTKVKLEGFVYLIDDFQGTILFRRSKQSVINFLNKNLIN